MSSLNPLRHIMVKFFTKSAPDFPIVNQKGSFVQDQRGCMMIIKGHLVPFSQMRGYADDKTTSSKEQGLEGKKPGLAEEDDDESYYSKKLKHQEKSFKEKEDKPKDDKPEERY